MKNKVVFTIGDENNVELTRKFVNSYRKFDTETPIIFYTTSPEIKLEGCEVRDIREDLKNDPHLWYRATPYFANKLFEEGYKSVLKSDNDVIILGNLDHIWKEGFDVCTTLNYNRVDPPKFGEVKVWDIHPARYFNAGFIVMNNHDFVKHWLNLCYSEHFDRYQFREQDLFNIVCYYCPWSWICLDDFDKLDGKAYWHNLTSKGCWHRTYKKGDDIILPADPKDGYPNMDIVLKSIHFAGGGHEPKNYRIHFPDEVTEYIDTLVKP